MAPTQPITLPRRTAVPPYRLALGQPVGIAFQVCVVIGESPAWVERVDGDAAGLAEEQPGDVAVVCRQHQRAGGRQDVDGLVAAFPAIAKGVAQLAGGNALHRHQQGGGGSASVPEIAARAKASAGAAAQALATSARQSIAAMHQPLARWAGGCSGMDRRIHKALSLCLPRRRQRLQGSAGCH
ncbi:MULTISPECIES: hypothetical protein [unclassified Polaromonas]|uniref:hypothetical protein n=1 Tax=unclassified Polaromonas TaxID=2638319 RepID=UPI0018CB1771|nr:MULTISPECIES: hypothetical protein [unclassified Polaromonas]MBG6070701.1 hypothetical protein [Polaromonas sp. CG_9.7]MBG6112991.1 hypothetical protein [Polaromonas sp. CG_9.2]